VDPDSRQAGTAGNAALAVCLCEMLLERKCCELSDKIITVHLRIRKAGFSFECPTWFMIRLLIRLFSTSTKYLNPGYCACRVAQWSGKLNNKQEHTDTPTNTKFMGPKSGCRWIRPPVVCLCLQNARIRHSFWSDFHHVFLASGKFAISISIAGQRTNGSVCAMGWTSS
jgi:hypothetical protein